MGAGVESTASLVLLVLLHLSLVAIVYTAAANCVAAAYFVTVFINRQIYYTWLLHAGTADYLCEMETLSKHGRRPWNCSIIYFN